MTIHLESVRLLRPAGISTRDQRPGRAIASRGVTRRDSIPSSAPFDPAESYLLKRSKFTQACIDVIAVLFAFLLVGVTAGSVVLSFVLLFFASF
jgi:hypothetical protein